MTVRCIKIKNISQPATILIHCLKEHREAKKQYTMGYEQIKVEFITQTQTQYGAIPTYITLSITAWHHALFIKVKVLTSTFYVDDW